MKKKTLSIIIVLLLAFHCYGQEKEQTKKAITYSVGIAYNQLWLPSFFYGADEFGTSSSPFNWGVSPFFSMQKNRWTFNFGCSYMSLLRNYRYSYSETRSYVDKWQEASLAATVEFRVTGERQRINITPFLGVDLSYLINYEKAACTTPCTACFSYSYPIVNQDVGQKNRTFSYHFFLDRNIFAALFLHCIL